MQLKDIPQRKHQEAPIPFVRCFLDTPNHHEEAIACRHLRRCRSWKKPHIVCLTGHRSRPLFSYGTWCTSLLADTEGRGIPVRDASQFVRFARPGSFAPKVTNGVTSESSAPLIAFSSFSRGLDPTSGPYLESTSLVARNMGS